MNSYYFSSTLLYACLNLWFQAVLDEGSTDVWIVFEVMKGFRIHRRETFEELHIAIEMIIIDLDIVSLFDPV